MRLPWVSRREHAQLAGALEDLKAALERAGFVVAPAPLASPAAPELTPEAMQPPALPEVETFRRLVALEHPDPPGAADPSFEGPRDPDSYMDGAESPER